MKGDLRCIEGRLFRHDPQYDDPDLETDVGECPDCEGEGCGDEAALRTCACKSDDAYDCWALRYHRHTAIPGMQVDEEGGPCECACHDAHEGDQNV